MNQTSPKWKILKRAFFWILIFFGIMMILGVLLPDGGLKSMGYHVMSWENMKQIAMAVQRFQKEHNGVIPIRLSELDSPYLSVGSLFFQSPYTTSVRPTEAKLTPEIIDSFSPYSFAVLPDQRILVFERPGMWLNSTMTYFLLGTDMQPVGTVHSCRVTPKEFRRRRLEGYPLDSGGPYIW